MGSWRERLQETRETVERRIGYTLAPTEKLNFLEESDVERRMLQRELDLLAYTALNYVGGAPQELKAAERRRLAQRSRIVWMKDPQAGAAVDLMNDFVFGRGLTKPKANDPAVQEVIDEAWDDPDNQLVLTDFFAQLALGTDFELQSNLFFLIFEDGQDGKVKLGLLDHDTVETVVRDEDNRLRILYYVARHWSVKWDFTNDQPMLITAAQERQRQQAASGNTFGNVPTKEAMPQVVYPSQGDLKYYEHWRNVEDVKADTEREDTNLCPPEKLGDGKVYHVAMNRGSEMAFGHPRMDRLIRWYNAYNNFMDARVDIMAASAAFVMKRKVKGTPQQLQKMANQALSRRSALAMGRDPMVGAEVGPKAASILTENESVSHEDFNINTNAPAAAQDAQMIRSMISAATRWPQSYYGDASQSNLATATSLELPVLKAVETRQTIFEHIVRFFTDRVIERAVDAGRLSRELGADEIAQRQIGKKPKPDKAPGPTNLEPGEVAEAYEDEGLDEEATQRDLGYEFQMPSPLQRLLGDLVLAVMNIAKTFDPNNTNTELSRTLLTVALQELGLEDPAGAVERVLPAGYVDPAVAAAEGPGGPESVAPGEGPAPGMPGSSAGEFSADSMSGPMGGDAQNGYGGGYGAGNPNGAVAASQSPEQVAEAYVWRRGREERLRVLREARVKDESPAFQRRVAERVALVDSMLDDALDQALETVAASNGAGDE